MMGAWTRGRRATRVMVAVPKPREGSSGQIPAINKGGGGTARGRVATCESSIGLKFLAGGRYRSGEGGIARSRTQGTDPLSGGGRDRGEALVRACGRRLP